MLLLFFFFKQKTAYEMRISDLSSDVCSSELGAGMPCGGSMRVYVEPIPVKPTLWIMGHGSIAESMCAIGDLVGLDVVVNDSTITRDRYPAATRLITDDLDYRELKPTPGDFVIVATQHKGDHESMKRALDAKPNYIALIASRKRAGLVMDYLRDAGFPEQELDKVVARAGLDLGARTPEEIALSVISEIVALRRGGSGMRLQNAHKSTQTHADRTRKVVRACEPCALPRGPTIRTVTGS